MQWIYSHEQESVQICSWVPNSHKSHTLFPFPRTRIIHTKNLFEPMSTASISCSTFFVFLLCQGFRVSTALAQKCYLPNGDEASWDTPCSPTSSNQASACCSPDDTCLSNRLCLNADMQPGRGSCTDQNWKSKGCAPCCQDGKTAASGTSRYRSIN